MRKEYKVQGSTGNMYDVYFSDETGEPKAGCTCKAGEHAQLCKHVFGIIAEDKEVYEMLSNYGTLGIYQEYLDLLEEADAIKAQAKKVKKKFERVLLR